MRHYNVPIFHQLIILLVTDKILGIIKIPLDDYIFKNYIDKKEYEKTIEKYKKKTEEDTQDDIEDVIEDDIEEDFEEDIEV